MDPDRQFYRCALVRLEPQLHIEFALTVAAMILAIISFTVHSPCFDGRTCYFVFNVGAMLLNLSIFVFGYAIVSQAFSRGDMLGGSILALTPMTVVPAALLHLFKCLAYCDCARPVPNVASLASEFLPPSPLATAQSVEDAHPTVGDALSSTRVETHIVTASFLTGASASTV